MGDTLSYRGDLGHLHHQDVCGHQEVRDDREQEESVGSAEKEQQAAEDSPGGAGNEWNISTLLKSNILLPFEKNQHTQNVAYDAKTCCNSSSDKSQVKIPEL